MTSRHPILPAFLRNNALDNGAVVLKPVGNHLAVWTGNDKACCTFGWRVFDLRRPLPARYCKPHRHKQRAIRSRQSQGNTFGGAFDEFELALRGRGLASCRQEREQGANRLIGGGAAQIVAQQAEGGLGIGVIPGEA